MGTPRHASLPARSAIIGAAAISAFSGALFARQAQPAAAGAGGPAQTASPHPDFSGYRELRFDSTNVPLAVLRPGVPDVETQRTRDMDVIRRCASVGMPAIMNDHSPIDLRQSPSVIGIMSKLPSSVRYIYLDGRPHPPMDDYEPTSMGHSIGVWDGDSLVVDTVAFAPERGIRGIPGGGLKTMTSHLVERYRLLPSGQLSVVFTWTDPAVFAKAHVYEFRYYRTKPTEDTRPYPCDATDPSRTAFLTGPPIGR